MRDSYVVTARMLALSGAAALVLGMSACGGSAHSPQSKLAHALSRGRGKEICDGSCKAFHAKSAVCADAAKLVDSFRFYRCTVRYDNRGRPDRVCAALNGSKLILRPLRICKP